MAGTGDMDAILDQALDDLENFDTAAVAPSATETSLKADTESDNPTSSSGAEVKPSQSKQEGQSGPVDPKEFFKYLIEGDDEVEEEDRNAQLDEFMNQVQTTLQGEAETVDEDDDSNGDHADNNHADDDVAATLASILEQMATIDQDDPLLSEGNVRDANFNPDDIVDGMMEQLLSKDLMYEPMKQVADRYPAWLEANQDTLSEEDLAKYVRVEISLFIARGGASPISSLQVSKTI